VLYAVAWQPDWIPPAPAGHVIVAFPPFPTFLGKFPGFSSPLLRAQAAHWQTEDETEDGDDWIRGLL
jgi:hypothetical protein